MDSSQLTGHQQPQQSQQPAPAGENTQVLQSDSLLGPSRGGLYIVITVRDLPPDPDGQLTDEQYAARLRNMATIEHEPESFWDFYFHIGENIGIRYRLHKLRSIGFIVEYGRIGRIRAAPNVVGLVQVNQIPWDCMTDLELIVGMIRLLFELCEVSMHVLNAEHQLNSRTWCLRVFRLIWQSGVDAGTAAAQPPAVNAQLSEPLQSHVNSWVRRIVRDIDSGPRLAPIIFWRRNDWHWVAWHYYLDDLHNIHFEIAQEWPHDFDVSALLSNESK